MKLVLLLIAFSLTFALNIEEINRQAYERIEYMQNIEEFPDKLKPELISLWIRQDRFPDGKLYINSRELTSKDMEEFLREANLENIEGKVYFGITLRRTNMRMYPSEAIVHKGNPRIDYNQYTLLEPFTPLAVLHSSRNKIWLYVHAPFMRGWVKKEDVKLVDREELLRLRRMPFLVVVKGRKTIGGVEFGLGSRVPYLEKRGNRYLVVLPDGRQVWTSDEGLHEGYMPFEESKAKEILESLLGEAYEWGGSWDCSYLVQSLFAVFGVKLPRNSDQQAKIGRVVANSFKSYEEFKSTLSKLPPFRTLVFLKGHVMVYGGLHDGDIVLYHAVHRLKRDDGSLWWINAVYKNLVEKDYIRNIYKGVVSLNLLD